MDPMVKKLIVILLLFLGEALAIYAEMAAARNLANDPAAKIFFKAMLFAIVAGALLISGYMLGFQAFKNIWIVSVASITSILIIEPILAILLFNQFPTTGALVGLLLGALGFIAAIFF